MNLELTQLDWEKSLEQNQLLIVNNKIQIEMALRVIELCKEKIATFPKEKKK